MFGFNRMETYKRMIEAGKGEIVLAMADMQLALNNITTVEFQELQELVFPAVEEVTE